jgi:hypothetical protein
MPAGSDKYLQDGPAIALARDVACLWPRYPNVATRRYLADQSASELTGTNPNSENHCRKVYFSYLTAFANRSRNSQCRPLAREDGVDDADDLRHPLIIRNTLWQTE